MNYYILQRRDCQKFLNDAGPAANGSFQCDEKEPYFLESGLAAV